MSLTSILPKVMKPNFNEYRIYSPALVSFLSNIDVFGEKCEWKQIESLFNIDLSIFLNYPVNIKPYIGEEILEDYYEAEDRNDTDKVKLLKKIISDKEKEWEESFHSINEGWTDVKEMKETLANFSNKIREYPNYYQELDFNLDWEFYFIPSFLKNPKRTWVTRPFPLEIDEEDKLDLHLAKMYSFVDEIEKKGHQYIRLSGGHTGEA